LRSNTWVATEVKELQHLDATTFLIPGQGPFRPPVGVSEIGLAKFEALMHEAELSADYFGVQYLYKSGYDPKCYTDFVQRIWSGMPASAPFTTYPPLSKRLKALQKEVVEILPKRDGAITSTPEFQEFRNHLQAKKNENGPPGAPSRN
jgi:predicted Zn-dependent protease